MTPDSAAAAEFGGFDTHDMVVVHRAFRRETRLLAELIATAAPGDTARARVLADHLADVQLGLHHHHAGEDELLLPPLIQRVPEASGPVLQRTQEQHRQVVASLTAVREAVDAWVVDADAASRDTVVTALLDHRRVLTAHLDAEEAELLPLASQYLTASEWKALGDHFVASTPKPKLLLFLGMVLEDADAGERAAVLRALPAPARAIWFVFGRLLYARTVRRVRHHPR